MGVTGKSQKHNVSSNEQRLSSFIKTVSRESIMKDNKQPSLNSVLFSRRLTLRSCDLNEMLYKYQELSLQDNNF